VRRSHQQAELHVADTGPGIPADELPHIFDRFWRGRAASARRGTGIGLAVVQSLIQAHSGTVSARCPTEGGTVFTVLLPAREMEPAGDHAQAAVQNE